MEGSAQPRLKVLVLDKGFGSHGLARIKSCFDCAVVEVPEPSDDLNRGVQLAWERAEVEKPDIIVASSRGGKIVAQLRVRGWKGPLLLLGAMSTSECIVPGTHVTLIHGLHDRTNPIERVRQDVALGSRGCVLLIELDDEHSLRGLSSEQLQDAAHELMQRWKSTPVKIEAPQAAPAKNPASLRVGLLGQLKARAKPVG